MQAKPKTKTDSMFIMLAACPAATAGFLAFLAETAWRYELIPKNDTSYEAFQLDILSIITLVLNFGLVVHLYRQKHTYQSQPSSNNPLLFIPFFIWSKIFGPVFFYGVMIFLTGFVFAMPALLLTKLTTFLAHTPLPLDKFSSLIQRSCGLITGSFALFTILVGISALSRSIRLWGAHKHLKNIATSKTRSAAIGVVELRGTAHAGPGMESGPHIPVLGTNPPYYNEFIQQAFLLQDESGSLLIDPGNDFDTFNPRLFLDIGKDHGLPVLMPGESIYVLGELRINSDNGSAVVGPWRPPHGLPYKRLRALLGPLGDLLQLLDSEDIFIISCGNEKLARNKLFLSRYRWFAFGLWCLSGGGLTAAIALSGLIGQPLLGLSAN
ncbi:MAG: hypothetical protein OEV64_05095 [Desulfobulbaceae bacterium]|nr:hypothetical protein [Desulfobulbaceae bacterium]